MINLVAVAILYFTKAETYFEVVWPAVSERLTKKDLVDYYMILVLVAGWLWFFFYFLIMEKISILLLTLFKMIGDALSFIMIMLSFFLFVASIFTTLYQDYNEEKYGNLWKSVSTLFNTMIGEYDYDDMGNREQSHTYLMIGIAFFCAVILMNYIIAILMTTYHKQWESGIFQYKSNLFQYCERYMIAFQSTHG